MKHMQTIQKPCIKSGSNTACGECQASCSPACKTSCTVCQPEVRKEEK